MLADAAEFCALCEQCLLPGLQADIGSELLDAQHFDRFRHQLNQRLPEIFAILNNRNTSAELYTVAVQRHLVLLFCEQTASAAAYKTDAAEQVRNFEELVPRIREWLQQQDLWTDALGWYKMRVTSSGWKRNLGATHGLARLCEIAFEAGGKSLQLSIDDCLFMLSAGTLMLEHFEHEYKALGLTILLTVLRHMSKEDLALTNLYDPIFDTCTQNIANIKDLHINRQLWSCLILCLGLKPSCQMAVPSKWNHRDDVCSALLNRLAFEGDYQVRMLLMNCVPDVFAPYQPIHLHTASDGDIAQIDYKQLREDSKASPCLTACRWTKKLVQIWSYHISCAFGSAGDVALNLRTVHICYLICLFGMPLAMVRTELKELLNEIPEHLLQLVQHHDRNAVVVKEVCDLLVTFEEHLDGAQHQITLNAEEQTFFHGRRNTLRELRSALVSN